MVRKAQYQLKGIVPQVIKKGHFLQLSIYLLGLNLSASPNLQFSKVRISQYQLAPENIQYMVLIRIILLLQRNLYVWKCIFGSEEALWPLNKKRVQHIFSIRPCLDCLKFYTEAENNNTTKLAILDSTWYVSFWTQGINTTKLKLLDSYCYVNFFACWI